MGEAKRKGVHGGGYTGIQAAQRLLKLYLVSGSDTELVLRDARLSDGSIVVACQIGGFTAALPTAVLRVLADAAEGTLRKFPNEPMAAGLPDFIMALRASADRVESIYGLEACTPRPPTRDGAGTEGNHGT